MTPAGMHLRPRAARADSEVGGHRTLHYTVADNEALIEDMVDLLRSLYVPRLEAFEHPAWDLGAGRAPQSWTVQVGDFGEALTYALMTLLDYEVPYVKLHSRTTRDATIQGPDTLCALVGSDTEVLVEVKTRTSRVTSGELRSDIRDGLTKDRDLFSSWTFAVQEFNHYPEKRKVYAFQVACELAELHHRRVPRRIERHGVIVCSSDGVDGEAFWTGWPDELPACTLHVIEVENLADVVRRTYERLNASRFGETIEADIAEEPLRSLVGSHAPGNVAPLRPTAAQQLTDSRWPSDVSAAVESACWFLADHDGYGHVCAHAISEGGPIGLSLLGLLRGDLETAGSVGPQRTDYLDFVASIDNSWRTGNHGDQVIARANRLADTLPEAEAFALRLVAASITYRLERHPSRFIAPIGQMSQRLHRSLSRRGVRAVWPGQAAVLSKGLLDHDTRAFAVEMATSAGKTLLIEMLAASTLDHDPDRLVVVLAPSRALVSQHTRDLQSALGRGTVTGLYGGFEVDSTDVDISGSVAVMTPERFELESRREHGPDSRQRRIQLLVVDEAHLLADESRGVRLELSLSNLTASGSCRIILLSSHLGDKSTLLRWLQAPEDAYLSSSWRPAPLDRGVFYVDRGQGVVRWEHRRDQPEVLVTVDARTARRPVSLFADHEPVPSRADRADLVAALAISLARQGTVLMFVPHSTSVRPVAANVLDKLERLGRGPHPDLEPIARNIEPVDPDAAALLRSGIGIHHRGLHSEVRRVVEQAARAGALHVIVSTSTLAEGVDAPIETVLITSLQIAEGVRLKATKLANLAGRAGRGGRYRAGRVVVRVPEETDPTDLEREIARSLPPTKSALNLAFQSLIARVRTRTHLALSAELWRHVDDLLLSALDDELENDGELRRAIEVILGRTLYSVERNGEVDELLIRGLETRARAIAAATPDVAERAVFRRTGLPYVVCQALSEAVRDLDADGDLADLSDQVALGALLREVVAVAVQHDLVQRVTGDDLSDAAERWVSGEDEASLIEMFPDWHKLVAALDYQVTWCLSGAVDLLAFHRSLDAVGRANLHQSAGVARVRYGAPNVEACSAIREGLPRRRALELHAQYRGRPAEDSWMEQASFGEWLRHYAALTPDDLAALGLDVED